LLPGCEVRITLYTLCKYIVDSNIIKLVMTGHPLISLKTAQNRSNTGRITATDWSATVQSRL
jgi:hypothetical protein